MYNGVSNSLELSWLRDSDLKKCVMSLYMHEKRMPFMNFKMVNAKNLMIEFKKILNYGISIHRDFNH